MNKLIEYLKKFKELYILASFLISLAFGLFMWGWTIESNQLHILKSLVYEFENNQKCGTNRFEYDEYIINYSSMFKLSKRHNNISKDAIFSPAKRKDKCKN